LVLLDLCSEGSLILTVCRRNVVPRAVIDHFGYLPGGVLFGSGPSHQYLGVAIRTEKIISFSTSISYDHWRAAVLAGMLLIQLDPARINFAVGHGKP
jgi:hypothetical protein